MERPKDYSVRRIAELEIRRDIHYKLPYHILGQPLNRTPLEPLVRNFVIDRKLAGRTSDIEKRARELQNIKDRDLQINRFLQYVDEFAGIRKTAFIQGDTSTKLDSAHTRYRGDEVVYDFYGVAPDHCSGTELAEFLWTAINKISTIRIDRDRIDGEISGYLNPLRSDLWNANDIDHSWDRHVNPTLKVVIDPKENISLELSTACHPIWGWHVGVCLTQGTTEDLIKKRELYQKKEIKERLLDGLAKDHLDERIQVAQKNGWRSIPIMGVAINLEGLTGRQVTPWIKRAGYRRLTKKDELKDYPYLKEVDPRKDLIYVPENPNGNRHLVVARVIKRKDDRDEFFAEVVLPGTTPRTQI